MENIERIASGKDTAEARFEIKGNSLKNSLEAGRNPIIPYSVIKGSEERKQKRNPGGTEAYLRADEVVRKKKKMSPVKISPNKKKKGESDEAYSANTYLRGGKRGVEEKGPPSACGASEKKADWGSDGSVCKAGNRHRHGEHRKCLGKRGKRKEKPYNLIRKGVPFCPLKKLFTGGKKYPVWQQTLRLENENRRILKKFGDLLGENGGYLMLPAVRAVRV